MSSNPFLAGNRNSTPEVLTSSLRPPTARNSMASGHQPRVSGDMGAFSGVSQGRNNRPASEIMYNQMQQKQNRNSQDVDMEKASRQWISDIDQCEAMLDEMAAAALDHEFKDELSAIEQWFKVCSEAERTAALYALIQQSTQVQIRFFVGVLQQMSKNHPNSVMLSPAGNSDRDSMSHRFSTTMNRMGDRNSLAVNRNSQAPSNKRNSGLDQDEIASMFPDAAAAIAQQKADFEQQTNRNSTIGDRSSMIAPTISAPIEEEKKDPMFGLTSPTPWGRGRASEPGSSATRPKSSGGPQPMGQFAQPPPSAGLRASRPDALSGDIAQTTSNSLSNSMAGMPPMFSPFQQGAGWASMMNTPMVPNFSMQPGPGSLADVAAATQNKLNALSTINNRMTLDAAPPYNTRRARSTEGGDRRGAPTGLNLNGGPLTDGMGQLLSPEQVAAMQQQQILAMNGGGRQSPRMNLPPQNNGYLSVFGSSPSNLSSSMAGLNMGGMGGYSTSGYSAMGDAGYHSDASGFEPSSSSFERGRSPRGHRGTSKPPEDPTDPALLGDVPSWLRTLRLHKYTDNLKDMRWQDIVRLDEEGLEAKGVSAKGARTKMLKVFEQIREAQLAGKIPSQPPSGM